MPYLSKLKLILLKVIILKLTVKSEDINCGLTWKRIGSAMSTLPKDTQHMNTYWDMVDVVGSHDSLQLNQVMRPMIINHVVLIDSQDSSRNRNKWKHLEDC